jgi:transcriptional regulator with XRE-family HTH domain
MKTQARWPEAHVNLKQLYEERVPSGMTQEEFGAKFGIGTQGMVWQYLNGHRPLNAEAAAKFARGLRCTIYDISPEMAEALKAEIVPVLGPKGWLRGALAKAAAVATMGVALYPLSELISAACVLCQIRIRHRETAVRSANLTTG